MRLLVTGSRDWLDALSVYDAIRDIIDKFPLDFDGKGNSFIEPDEVTVVHGMARGADTIADVCAQLIGCQVERHPGEWDTYGKRAGIIRNEEMLNSGVDYYLAFNEDLQHSSGTRHMVDLCEENGIPGMLITKGQVENLGLPGKSYRQELPSDKLPPAVS